MEDHAAVTVLRSAAVLAAIAAAVACGSARRGEPLLGPLVTTGASQDRGRVVFMQHCHKCHPGGEAGLGPSLNDKRLPKMINKFQVRHALGVMPAFGKSRISDKALEDLTAYLALLRRHERASTPFEARENSR